MVVEYGVPTVPLGRVFGVAPLKKGTTVMDSGWLVVDEGGPALTAWTVKL